MSAPRILIVKTSSMGDIVHALPLVSDLAAHLPGASIDWVLEEGFAPVARLHPAVENVHTVALRRWRKQPFAAATWSELREARAALRAQIYDCIIDCQGLAKSAWVSRWARGKRIGFDRASAREPLAAFFYDRRVHVPRGQHAITRNRALGAAAFGYVPDQTARFALRVPPLPPGLLAPHAEDGGRSGYAVLLTNASRPTKLWPDERWQAVEAWLSQRGLGSLLFWGSTPEQDATRARALRMREATVLPRLALDSAAAVLAGARVVIGLDTGLSHLAAAVGAPTVGIYCDYDPALVGLVGDAPCESLGGVQQAPSADAVIAAAARVMGETGSGHAG
jgi:heptosyltransferase-1